MWTSEQKSAIELRHANLLVSAAAGSGKTAVLVERVIQLILSGETQVDKLLVVTYTNAAAGEMRERIEVAIENAIENKRGDVKMLSEQLKKLGRSSIKTFHSFCLDVIRSHFQLLDIDPSFRMINDSEKMILIETALDEILEEAYETLDPAFVSLVEGFSGNRNDLRLRKMILQLYGFILAHPDPLAFLAYHGEVYGQKEHPVRKMWADIMLEHFRLLLDNALEHLSHAMELCGLPGGPEPYIKTLQSDYEKVMGLKEASEIGLKALELSVETLKFDRLASIKKDEKDLYDEDLIQSVKSYTRDKVVKKQVVQVIKDFFDYKKVDTLTEEIDQMRPFVEALSQLTLAFYHRYAAMKREGNLMDFSDLEHFAVTVLNHENIAETFKLQFDYIFVDEYQDASAIQEHIVNAIKRPNNVFMVGDVKQSIYKFRLADPTLFLQKYKAFTHIDALCERVCRGELNTEKINGFLKVQEEESFVRIDLRSNFRSRPSVLNEVNGIFENIMSEDLGDVAYDKAAKLYGKMHFEDTQSPYLEMALVSKKALSEEDGTEDVDLLEDLKSEDLEARVIARKIKDCLGTPLYFPKTQTKRACRYKDITVLMRSTRSWSVALEQVFIEEGIPLYTESQTGYFDTLEIKWLMALLKVIDNPLNDEAFLTVMHAPFFGFSLETLAYIKSVTPDIPYYYYKIQEEGIKACVSEGTFEHLMGFFQKLEKWKAWSLYKPVEDFLWRILSETGFMAYVTAMPGGTMRAANVTLLIERASELRRSNLFSLSHFVRFIEQMIEASGDMGIAKSAGEQEDVVKLMSIHKSKGLEFPVVIVGGLGRKFNQMDTTGDLVLHKDLGIAMPMVDLELRTKTKTLPQFALKEKIKRETLSEEMRVLYVGLTRAVDRMILVATVSDVTKKQVLWAEPLHMHRLIHAEGFADWIVPNLSPSAITVYEPKDIAIGEIEDDQAAKNALRKLEERVQEVKAFDRQWMDARMRLRNEKDLQLKPLKISVSDMKNEASQMIEMKRPNFLLENADEKAMSRGTLIHQIFEKLPLDREMSIKDIERLLLEWTENGFLEASLVESVNLFKIKAFLDSQLGIRIRKSPRIYKETPFVLLHDEQLVQGVIDLYFEEEDQWVLVDYKTDGLKGRTLDEVAKPYLPQLSLYKNAIEQLTGKKVKESFIYFIEMEKVYKV